MIGHLLQNHESYECSNNNEQNAGREKSGPPSGGVSSLGTLLSNLEIQHSH